MTKVGMSTRLPIPAETAAGSGARFGQGVLLEGCTRQPRARVWAAHVAV